jgi:hypothetical protein
VDELIAAEMLNLVHQMEHNRTMARIAAQSGAYVTACGYLQDANQARRELMLIRDEVNAALPLPEGDRAKA